MKQDSVYPLSDVMFKQVFGSRQSAGITAAFLSAVLGLDPGEYRSLHISDPNLGRRWKKDKLSIPDLLLNTASGKFIHVEVQGSAYTDMIRSRVEYPALQGGESHFPGHIRSGPAYNRADGGGGQVWGNSGCCGRSHFGVDFAQGRGSWAV